MGRAGSDGSAGGLVGGNIDNSGTITVDQSFVTGSVSCAISLGHGDPTFTGGGTDIGSCGALVGNAAGTENVTNSYYLSGMALSNDGGQLTTFNGATQESLPWFYDPSNPPLSSWDFTTIWLSNLGSSALPTLR